MLRWRREYTHALKMVVHLPGWLFTHCMWPFLPKTHPWKLRNHDKMFTLDDWTEHATQFTLEFSIMLWVCPPFFAYCIWGLNHV